MNQGGKILENEFNIDGNLESLPNPSKIERIL